MSLQVLQMQSCVCVWQCVAVWFQMCATPGLINGSFLISLREILHQRPLTWFLSRPSLSVIHNDLSESVQQSRQKSVTNVSLLCFPNTMCALLRRQGWEVHRNKSFSRDTSLHRKHDNDARFYCHHTLFGTWTVSQGLPHDSVQVSQVHITSALGMNTVRILREEKTAQ